MTNPAIFTLISFCYLRTLLFFLVSYNPTKLPVMVLVRRTSRSFLWCWLLLLFYLTGGFYFAGYFFLPPALHPGFSDQTSTCFTFAKLFRHILRRALWFLPTGNFYLALLPHSLTHFMTQMRAGTPHPGYSSMPAFIELSLMTGAWFWTTHIADSRPLVYQLCQWASKYKLKAKLLNMFQTGYACSKSYVKSSKYFEQDLLISTAYSCFD